MHKALRRISAVLELTDSLECDRPGAAVRSLRFEVHKD
jgi:hypothetical protein